MSPSLYNFSIVALAISTLFSCGGVTELPETPETPETEPTTILGSGYLFHYNKGVVLCESREESPPELNYRVIKCFAAMPTHGEDSQGQHPLQPKEYVRVDGWQPQIIRHEWKPLEFVSNQSGYRIVQMDASEDGISVVYHLVRDTDASNALVVRATLQISRMNQQTKELEFVCN